MIDLAAELKDCHQIWSLDSGLNPSRSPNPNPNPRPDCKTDSGARPKSLSSSASVEIRMLLPSGLSYFNGHFPHFPVLPAVALLEISKFLSSQYLNRGPSRILNVHSIKVRKPICPNEEIIVHLEDTPKSKGEPLEIISLTSIWRDAKGLSLAELTWDSQIVDY